MNNLFSFACLLVQSSPFPLQIVGMLRWVAFCLVVQASVGGWIDPDTDLRRVENITSFVDGRKHRLVFSDEFNVENRRFHDGSDPRWTALNKDDYTNFALHYYNHDLVKTSNGFLNISTIVEDVTFTVNNANSKKKKSSKMTKNYQSAMLQGWNKFCFTGGIVEISARLPGHAHTGGLWPAMWMMGNLARATYIGSSNNIWPWSADKCVRGKAQRQQYFSACNSATHFGLNKHQGRGAPEIDILEAMPGFENLHKNNPNTYTHLPYYSASLQVSPGVEGYVPTSGELPSYAQWYSPHYLEYGPNTSLNIFFYGMHLEGVTPERSYSANALSANRNIEKTHFETQHVYRLEWVKGEEGYLQWHLDGELVYRIEAKALNITGAIIPEEPMYLLLNTAISSTWGFPAPCPEGCACDCFDCRDEICACAVPHGMCQNLPASMLIDYVRVYQAVGDDNQTVGCSIPSHPTKTFIEAHPDLYKNEWDEVPLKAVQRGGGSCVYHHECGGHSSSSPTKSSDNNINDNSGSKHVRAHTGGDSVEDSPNRSAYSNNDMVDRGSCVRGRCQCSSNDYTGPYCLAANAFNDIVYDEDPDFIVSFMMIPHSLIYISAIGLALLVVLGVWKYRHDATVRGQYMPIA